MKRLLVLAMSLMLFSGQAQLVNGDFENGLAPSYSAFIEGTNPHHQDIVNVGWNGVTSHGGGDSLMMVDGIDDPLETRDTVWAQQVTVTANTLYSITLWLDARNLSVTNTVDLTLRSGASFIGDIEFTDDTTSGWVDFTFTFNSGANTSIYLNLRQNNAIGASDFNLDDISLTPLVVPCDVSSSFTSKLDEGTCEWEFTANSTANNGSTNIVAYYWDFGDGTTSTDPNPVHYYATPGNYNVCLTTYAVNSNGDCCSDKTCREIEASCEVGPCGIDGTFKYNYLDNCEISFYRSISTSGHVISYNWDFGDGNTGNGAYVNHTYANAGTYNVCLSVVAIDNNGDCCTFKYCEEVTVEGCDKRKRAINSGSSNATEANSNVQMSEGIKIYPNPGSSNLNIDFIDQKLDAQNLEILIFDLSGKNYSQIAAGEKVSKNGNTAMINISELPKGLYIMRIKNNGKLMTQKFIKE
ncbi:PKD domain-containing protein [Croceimicrobium hydrocarbonivorans]|uniref:PKD domain-containing protein n=1 Tax=Croceimicrobium hydrocarbonivorans TaxID=2761580 RepID=A0A7H0VHK5_9FLAO|nr:PKD domain-containing protein [Croceimicrobium hydrocarbonivorans]QNR25203.1 PKD domain-containing protein [Croceimicrobium hydrocarbonivorans]